MIGTALVALLACTPDNEIQRVSITDVFLQAANNQVDILFVVDNSLSMFEEQEAVSQNFDTFIGGIEETNIDFHIGVVTTDMDSPDHRGQLQGEPAVLSSDVPDYDALFRERVFVGLGGSDKEQGIEAAITATTEPLLSGSNAGFRRPDATLSIIYLSDENDCTHRGGLAGIDGEDACYDNPDKLVDVATLIAETQALGTSESRVLVSGIVGPTADQGCGEVARPGLRYHTMIEAFGGLNYDICDASWASIMDELGLQASGVLDSFQLSEQADEATIEVAVEEELVPPDPNNGWTFDPEYRILYFHGDAVPPRGSTISVTYYVGY